MYVDLLPSYTSQGEPSNGLEFNTPRSTKHSAVVTKLTARFSKGYKVYESTARKFYATPRIRSNAQQKDGFPRR